MKNLFYLLFVLPLLFSCGDATSDKPEVAYITLDNIEVYESDLAEMTWTEAKKACADLGDGWRLPTLDELKSLCENQEKIGGFTDRNYWSSSIANYEGSEYPYGLYFNDCEEYFSPNPRARVRPVRTKE